MARVEVKSTENGPNLVLVDGKVVVALCRCGGSSNKPRCDGTHAKIKFLAKPAQIDLLK
jgi:CDGSH-type Zn-finger protein